MGAWLDPTWKLGIHTDPTSEGIRSVAVLIHLKDHIDRSWNITTIEANLLTGSIWLFGFRVLYKFSESVTALCKMYATPGKIFLLRVQVGNKNVRDVIHGKFQAEGGQMSRLGKNGKITVQGTSVLSITNENV